MRYFTKITFLFPRTEEFSVNVVLFECVMELHSSAEQSTRAGFTWSGKLNFEFRETYLSNKHIKCK